MGGSISYFGWWLGGFGAGESAEIPVVDTACISIRANAPAVSIAPGEPVIRLQAGGKRVSLKGRCRGNDD